MILLTGAPGACTTPPSAEVQVIDISQIGPILTEIRNEIAYYNATVRGLPAAEAPRLTPGNHARPVVSFVLPQSPVTLTKPPAPRVSALPGQSDT
ncbi:hypothetical protein [Tanticharoenia sakaeratensis]|nr:hypothetical protein [Tanticharoenia sakaeratensis]GBQ16583.1 hypothetical protein AA103193_0037 [Tanticharoenia sakaeratensis NBRC 103193]